ncbi:hypothetical protein CA13_40800 [Planctomycetes bacterium CA13]|uniref:Uncharacterized protein n=1 Tax=Novipirellula herctigrandis TaxID=2527986 RepID=A0A5C5Z6B6_9BACT|nr:hypothetical protein CA13_40800 [Planctomycetes bacterium CA13]
MREIRLYAFGVAGYNRGWMMPINKRDERAGPICCALNRHGFASAESLVRMGDARSLTQSYVIEEMPFRVSPGVFPFEPANGQPCPQTPVCDSTDKLASVWMKAGV